MMNTQKNYYAGVDVSKDKLDLHWEDCLNPFVRDSGKMKGRRTIRGGRGQIRKCLFMAATSASRHHPILKEFYDRLRAKGKAHHLAVTAVMRKLICLMNRLLADPEFVLKN